MIFVFKNLFNWSVIQAKLWRLCSFFCQVISINLRSGLSSRICCQRLLGGGGSPHSILWVCIQQHVISKKGECTIS